MFDYEGSRSEFLKLLVECGEEPAFIARARAPQTALDALLRTCATQRDELLKWPALRLAALAQQIRHDWSRLGPLLADPESVTVLEKLCADLPAQVSMVTNWFASDKSALREFLESGNRFNRRWRDYLEGLDLEPVNKPRRDYNQFFSLEKACAFGSEDVNKGFVPLALIDRDYLYERFPLLELP